MKKEIKQFIPQEFCLKCQGCCRFSRQDSAWLPCLLDEEIQELLDNNSIPAANISIDRRIQPVADEKSGLFFCAFFKKEENKCRIYDLRPFECGLYPFLITLRGKKVLLTVDLNCPYIQEKTNSSEFKEYVQYLTDFLNSPSRLKMLKSNPQVIQAYEEVLDVVELKDPNAVE